MTTDIALLSAIVSQQVSVASANAIWARLEAAETEWLELEELKASLASGS